MRLGPVINKKLDGATEPEIYARVGISFLQPLARSHTGSSYIIIYWQIRYRDTESIKKCRWLDGSVAVMGRWLKYPIYIKSDGPVLIQK